MNNKAVIISAGAIVGILAVVLVKLGNPPNMGVCIACFLRDIAGAIGLHRANTVQYLRPEILGLVIGAFATAVVTKEFRVWGWFECLHQVCTRILCDAGPFGISGVPAENAAAAFSR